MRDQAVIDGLRPVLDVLCPMHLVLSSCGHVVHAGPTLAKLRAGQDLTGLPFLDLFGVTRPRGIDTPAALAQLRGGTLRLVFRAPPHTTFKACILPCGAGSVLNLSFGISIMDALRDYALSSADFAATDMTVEMLYLAEAKSAAMEQSRKLNLRLRGAMVAAEEQALTDTLTGLANRRALDQRLARLERERDGFALMHLDLDLFKAVNDTFGHAAGDHVLCHVAAILTGEMRSGDLAARIGGDEFVLLFPGLQHPDQLDRIARRIIARISQPVHYGDNLCRISCSAGSVLSGDYDKPDAARMLADADQALYAAKRDGRGCHRFFAP
jgi:diguanylate cyclase (GGDEF)-like protein